MTRAGGERSDSIFETNNLRVRFVSAGGGDRCVVSFSSFADDPRLDRPGFGESFLLAQGCDAIHVINGSNVWYQSPETPQALRAIREAAAPYARVFTYGSSMGGYAAIRFAETIGARRAIAISPQYSVAPNRPPFDRRWRGVTRGVDFSAEDPRPGSLAVEPMVFYDPFDLDALHFDMIARAFPHTRGVRLRHAGHPAGAYLAETGLLSSTIASILDDRFDPADVETQARLRRRRAGQYFFTLARRLPARRGGQKLTLARMATEVAEDASYFIYRSLLVEQAGDVAQAEALLGRAATILPDHPAPRRAIAVFLLRQRRFAEAIAASEQLFNMNPACEEFAQLARLACLAAGESQRVPHISRRRRAADPQRRPSFGEAIVDHGATWLAQSGRGRLARSWILRYVARRTALKVEMKRFNDKRAIPVWRLRFARLSASIASALNKVKDPR